MSLNAKKATGGGTKQEAMEAGGYPSRLVQVIDLGIQPQKYMGEVKEPAHEIMTTYEFVDEFIKDDEGNEVKDKPRWLSERFVLHNLDKSERANSTLRYRALDPDEVYEGDWPSLLGAPVLTTVTAKPNKKGRISNYIASTSPMRAKEASKMPELVNPPKVFDMEKPDLEIFLSLPDWVQGLIKDGLEFDGSPLDIALKGHTSSSEASVDKEATTAPETKEDPQEASDEDDGDW